MFLSRESIEPYNAPLKDRIRGLYRIYQRLEKEDSSYWLDYKKFNEFIIAPKIANRYK